MLLFLAIALSALWICSCLLGLALGAMLARAEEREPARRPRARPDRSTALERLPADERVLPTA